MLFLYTYHHPLPSLYLPVLCLASHGADNNQDDLDDEPPMHDDLGFMVEPETPYLAPPSILSEAPPSVMQVSCRFSET